MSHDPPSVPDVLSEGRAAYEPLILRNTENYVGLARVPIGLAGPLEIHGEHVDGIVHVPMATTEGTLVASTCRGMKVLRASGGAHTRVVREGVIQRAPVFELDTVADAVRLANTLSEAHSWLSECVAQTTRHGHLAEVRAIVLGRDVHLRLSMRSGDAAGQNMVSVAAARCVDAIMARHGSSIRRVWLEGGFGGEKVPSALNRLLGRGWSVAASATIPGEVLRTGTRAEPDALVKFHQVYTNAALQAGQSNSHASLINVLPAIYIATGQDVASVPESCMAHNAMQYDPDSDVLRWEVHCPNLVLGTVGGGTHLPTQRACLAMLGCEGAGRAGALAEICAATALANEISFWSAICAREWVAAHAKARSLQNDE